MPITGIFDRTLGRVVSMQEAWERAVAAALGGGSPSPPRSLTLDGAVKCIYGQLHPFDRVLDRFQSLEHLSIANIGVSSLEKFPRLGNLQRLILSDNRISGGLEFLVGAGLESLRDLDLSNNRIQSLEDLAPLARLRLVSLDLYECPVTRIADYRARVFALISSLKYLDKLDSDGNERPESDDDDDDDDDEDDEEEEEEDPGSGEVDGEEKVTNGVVVNGIIDVDEDDESDADEEETVRPTANGSHHVANGFRVAPAGEDEDDVDDEDFDEDDVDDEDGDDDGDQGEEIDEDDVEDEDVVEVHDISDSDDGDGVEAEEDLEEEEEDDEVDGDGDEDEEDVEDEEGPLPAAAARRRRMLNSVLTGGHQPHLLSASTRSATLQINPSPRLKTLNPTLRRRAAATRCSAAPPSRSYAVTILPGDGIGPEVISVAKAVLSLAGSLEGIEFRFREMPVGGAALDLVGVPLPEETLTAAKESDGVLLGAMGGYKWDGNEKKLKPETGLLQLRAGLGVFANLRPATVLPQLVDASTLKREIAEGVDIMVVRELTGGIYFGEPKGFATNNNGEEIGFNTEVYSASEIDRIARVAFEVARTRRGNLCSVDKANVLESSMLWRKRVTMMASEYPDVQLSHMYVDNAAMQLIRDPKQFDTIVTNNIFGDILSDEASMLTGSIGMLPSASTAGSGPGLFEPIHGSAPDIAGQDKANPLATVLSAAMLLRYGLGEESAARRIDAAVIKTLDKGFRTGDMYSAGTVLVGCKKMGEELLKSVESEQPVTV